MRSVLAFAVCVVGFLALDARAVTPPSEMQKNVRAATFEVVVPKPAESGVTYERPFSLDLLPFSERNDRYWSVGTAFAIAPDTFVTAAHVLQASIGGMGGPPALRAANGETYPIDQVLKFSLHQDFAVVSTAKAPAAVILETTTETEIDEPVFAVGNAFGEGVVIRDGLLTSMTPEEQDGRWKWLRYSAATSPGNSGGPLLNLRGQVIGVVIATSPSENLNYALPISHVMSTESAAVADTRFPLSVPMLRDTYTATIQSKFVLPLKLDEFASRMLTAGLEAYHDQLRKFLARSEGELFPRGRSAKVLANIEKAYCPKLLMQGSDRTWEVEGSKADYVELPDDGQVCIREHAGYTLFSIERGKVVGGSKFYSDTRLAMDLLLKGLKIPRYVGGETIQVTSLGAAVSDTEHVDRFERRWRLRVWNIPYLDGRLICMFLPTPKGYVGIGQFMQRGSVEMAVDPLKLITDYFSVSYDGTFAQWKSFFSQRDSLPEVFADVRLERDEAGDVHFRSPRVDLHVPSLALQTDEKSTVEIQMTFGEKAGKATWEIGAIYVIENGSEENQVGAIRRPMPGTDAGKQATDRWEQMLARKDIFSDERGHTSDYKKTWRRSAVNSASPASGPVAPGSTVLYEIVSTVQNPKLPRDVDDLHERVLENLRVKEK